MPSVPIVIPSEIAKVEVAWHRLDPGVGDPHRGAAQRLVVEADPLHVGARGGPGGAVEDGARARSRKRQAAAPTRRARHSRSRTRSRLTWPGSTWRTGTCMFATEINSRS